jgi:hypothetical protein
MLESICSTSAGDSVDIDTGDEPSACAAAGDVTTAMMRARATARALLLASRRVTTDDTGTSQMGDADIGIAPRDDLTHE